MNDTSVVHLVWQPAGPASLKRFVETYRAFPAGIDHDLVVVFKDFSGSDPAEHRRLLAEVPHRELVFTERGRDITAYFWAARRLETRYVCFLNSNSTPLVDGWLGTLHEHVADNTVGAVGATGSWESYYSSYLHLLTEHPRIGASRWLWSPYQRWKLRRYAANFAPAPNPHLRSNAFVIDRSRLLSLKAARLKTKWDTSLFESGKRGMTAQLLALGLKVLVVGRDGCGYQADEWPNSATYRAGEQENLLIGDNRTRDYDEGDPAERSLLSGIAWSAG